jgi:4-hydroxy-tetrahydrodipicolinate reductase
MKIAIVGYGAMGKEIELIAKEKNIIVANVFDIDTPINKNVEYDFDVAIEFSSPAVVLSNVKLLASKGKNIIIGTTGWYDRIDEVKKIANDYDVGIIWSSNFSIGMQIFYKIVNEASKLIGKFEQYDSFITEFHHTNKSDSPSGTAISLANIMLLNLQYKDKILTESIKHKIAPNELQIASIRGGKIFGEHTIYFDSEVDTIELKHNAKSRKGFAAGAILAANYIFNKKGFHNFENILFE